MKNKELKKFILYLIVGAGTTLVNYLVYFLLIQWHQNWLFANCIAWIFAVVFAFYSNKKIVFQSTNSYKKEAIDFLRLRLGTLLIENILLFIFIDCLVLNNLFSKIGVSFITVIANYYFCKWNIFNQKEEVVYE